MQVLHHLLVVSGGHEPLQWTEGTLGDHVGIGEMALREPYHRLPWPLPTDGETSFQLAGDMTVHGVTKPATWEVTAQFSDGSVTGQAKTSFTFGTFDMAVPRLFFILSVEDNIRLEMDFVASVTSG